MHKTVGQQVVEHRMKGLQQEDDIREYSREWGKDLMPKIQIYAMECSKHPPFDTRDFYVVVSMNWDRILWVAKPWFHPPRVSCPTPVYKQTVWKYHRSTSELEFLWDIPSKERYYDILRNKVKWLTSNDPATRNKAKWVILMESGELLDWVKKQNGEKPDALITNNPKAET